MSKNRRKAKITFMEVCGLSEEKNKTPDWAIKKVKRIAEENDIPVNEVVKRVKSLLDDKSFCKLVPDRLARLRYALMSVDSSLKSRATRYGEVEKYKICPFGFEQFRKSGKMRIYAYIPKAGSKAIIIVNKPEVIGRMDEFKAFRFYEVELSRSTSNPNTMFVTDESEFIYQGESNIDRYEFFTQRLGIPVVQIADVHKHVCRVQKDGNIDPMDLILIKGYLRVTNRDRGVLEISDESLPPVTKLGRNGIYKMTKEELEKTGMASGAIALRNPIFAWTHPNFLSFQEAVGFVVGRVGLRAIDTPEEVEGGGEEEEYFTVSINAIYAYPEIVTKTLDRG